MNSISQYVSKIIHFTSQYGANEDWSAENIKGPPLLKTYGSNARAWCPSTDNQNQQLELEFEISVFVKQVKIYENCCGGAVTKIEAFNHNNDNYEIVWATNMNNPRVILQYNIFCPDFKCTLFMSNRIRLTLTLQNRNVFSQIEAVELVGSLFSIEIPKNNLSIDMSKILMLQTFSDLILETKSCSINNESPASFETIRIHKCLLETRAPMFHKFIKENNYKLLDFTILEVKILMEYVYTDELDEVLLEQLINFSNKVPIQNIYEKYGQSNKIIKNNSWKHAVNQMIRHSIRFNFQRLEKLLYSYLKEKHLNLENFSTILLDATNYFADNRAQNSIGLDDVEKICFSFIQKNFRNFIMLDYNLEVFPRKFLLKLIEKISE